MNVSHRLCPCRGRNGLDGRASGRKPGRALRGSVVVTDFFLDLFFGMANGTLDGLPDDPFPQGFDLGWIRDMNYFLPIGEMFGLFIIFFALGGPFVASSLIIWAVVGVLRGGSTKA